MEPTIGIEPMNLFLTKGSALPTELRGLCRHKKNYKMAGSERSTFNVNGAGDEARTRDIQLGRLKLYQLSYSRLFPIANWTSTFLIFAAHHLKQRQDKSKPCSALSIFFLL